MSVPEVISAQLTLGKQNSGECLFQSKDGVERQQVTIERTLGLLMMPARTGVNKQYKRIENRRFST